MRYHGTNQPAARAKASALLPASHPHATVSLLRRRVSSSSVCLWCSVRVRSPPASRPNPNPNPKPEPKPKPSPSPSPSPNPNPNPKP
eukprot:scaffold85308_cov27-Phaeocystis_antarctica.AAC.1